MDGKDIILFFIPILSVLPFGGLFLKEYTSGFLKMTLVRVSRAGYVRKKVMKTSVGSFFLFFFIGLFFLAVFVFFWYPISEKSVLEGKEILSIFLMLLRISLIGSFLAVLSGIFGVLFLNYYMAYGLPFVLYYILIIVKERYFPDFYCFYPAEWLVPEEYWGAGNFGIWLFLILLNLITAVIYENLLYIRIKEIG